MPLTLRETDELIQALEACDALRDSDKRALVLRRVPESIPSRFEQSGTLRVQVAKLVDACAEHAGGLNRLREAVRWLEGPSRAMHRLDRLYARHHQRLQPCFLTFQANDLVAAETLAASLHAEDVALWLDHWNLAPGDPWNPAIDIAFDECATCVLLIGASGSASNLHEAMRMALAARVEQYPMRVIPVLLPGAGRDAIRAYAPFLAGVDHVELTGPMSTSVSNDGGLQHLLALIRSPRTDRAATATVPGTRSQNPSGPLQERLNDTIARRQRLESAGASADVLGRLGEEIKQLKRELRQGGRLDAGDILGERYLLIDKLGRGGFATVWRALDQRAQMHVAIKVMHSELAGDIIRRQRFLRGARIMAELEHDAVVKILTPSAECDGFHFFVMEYLPGGNLFQAVTDGRVGPDDAIAITTRLGQALSLAHERGYIHRDVKPENVLLTHDGQVKLTDFDLVAGEDTTGGTRTGAMGTVLYAAPEMWDRPQDADARADVYSLAMTCVFILNGGKLPLDVMRDAQAFVGGLRKCKRAQRSILKRALRWERDLRTSDVATFCVGMTSSQRDRRHISRRPGPSLDHQWLAWQHFGVDLQWPVETEKFATSASATGAGKPTLISGERATALLEPLQGAWVNPSTNSYYFTRMVMGVIHCVYAYEGMDSLDGEWTTVLPTSDDALICWFRWVEQPEIRGVTVLKIHSNDSLSGYWRGYASHTWIASEWRRVGIRRIPGWAEEYFANLPDR